MPRQVKKSEKTRTNRGRNTPASQTKNVSAPQSTGKQKPFHLEFKNEAQKMAWKAFDQHDVLFLLGPAGCGKAQTLSSKLYTRQGFVTMGEIKVGDEIANPDGNFSKITGVFPQGKKQICRVHFSDNTYVDCCEDHLWTVSHSDNGWQRVVDTKFIEKNCKRKDGKRILSIPCTKPVNFNRFEHVIPPYLMGILLAEGCFKGGSVCFSSSEKEIYQKVGSCLDSEYIYKTIFHKKSVDHRIVKARRGGKNKYKDELKLLGLWGKYSWEKHIPEQYLFSSVDQRIALLQGLMDGDGGVEKTGAITFCTTSEKLAKDFSQLVYSLGGSTKICLNKGAKREDGTRHRVSYRCYLNISDEIKVFFLNRKQRLVQSRSKYFSKRYIDRVERLGEEEMQCISVDHKDSLYLTDNFTVTHNTFMACAFAITEILAKRRRKIILTRPIVEAGEYLGYLPGDINEKTLPYMLPMYDCIQKCVGLEGPQKELIDKSMEVAPLAFMRGRAETLDSLLVTPSGLTKMGDIKVNDMVIGSSGEPIKVTGVYPQGKKKIWKINFSDKTFVKCSEDHLWSTMSLNEKRHGKGFSVKSTKEIIETITNKHQKVHRMPMLSGAVQFESREVTIDPYLMGKKSHNKFLPENYKINSEEVRLEVLRGLMDTDGSVFIEKRTNKVRTQYYTTSKQLADDVMFLVRSLGGYAYLRKREFDESDSHLYEGKIIRHVNSCYVVDIRLEQNPFKLKIKADKYDLGEKTPYVKLISSAEYIGEEECQCISVDSDDRLYLTNGFNITHNTFDDSICIFDEAQNATEAQLKLFMTRFGENSKIIITGDPNQSDLRYQDQALMKVVKKLEDLPGIGVLQFKSSSIVRHPLIASIIERLEEKKD